MSLEQTISNLSQLPPQERILVAQAIWDGLVSDANETMTPETLRELERRWDAYKANPSSALSLDEFKKQVREAKTNETCSRTWTSSNLKTQTQR